MDLKERVFMLYRIGEFAQLCGLSVKPLRYYDDIGLLSPVKVDEFTGYRYYSERQLDDVEKIKVFKSCSFSLDELVGNWGRFNTSTIRNKKAELLNHIQDIMNQVQVLDYIESNPKEFGIEEKSDSYTNENKDVKVLRFTKPSNTTQRAA
jgi:DNA-binding transcriptional MerR regulator